MGLTVILAEKYAVAKSIAPLVGATTRKMEANTGYIEGNGYAVTWAAGHLVGLKTPEEHGFTNNEVPMFPKRWQTAIIDDGDPAYVKMVKKQMKVIESLFSKSDRIIVATDAAREGELIFRYIYEYINISRPFDRLWISSLTDEAIRKGLQDLRPGEEFENLSSAAHARSEADWLVGLNASRALRLAAGKELTAGKKLSLGRVQTPVLCMICNRYDANKNFVPTPFWQIRANIHKNMSDFTVLSESKFKSEAEAKQAAAIVESSKRMRVTKVEKKKVTSKPPLLYDLTALQRDANTRYGLTAAETSKIAEELYLNKYLTYPRTSSRYIPDDVFKTIPSLIQKAAKYEKFAQVAASMEGMKLCKRSVDASKVTDHHGFLPTEVFPTNLTGNQKKIWEMVCARMLEAFGEDSISERTSVGLDCNGIAFKASGSVLVKAGWKAVNGAKAVDEADKAEKGDEDDESENRSLPVLTEGEVLPAGRIETVRKTDKPLPIYTDASLLGEMETCGKKIDDEELRESMKDVGLGTPATRAETIEKLITAKYIERKSDKKLIPTNTGLDIWRIFRDRKLADVRLTGEWERDLALIEQGKMDKAAFDDAICRFVEYVVDDIRTNCNPESISAFSETVHNCPICGKPMKNMKFSIICDPETDGCGFKIRREIAGKKLPASAIEALAAGKRTAVIKGFKSKSGKPFDCRLKVDRENRKVTYDFDEPPQVSAASAVCPCCGKPMTDEKWKLTCGCGFILYKSVGGVALTQEQIEKLLSGGSVSVYGMKNKAGKTYSAKLTVNPTGKKLDYEFINTPKKK